MAKWFSVLIVWGRLPKDLAIFLRNEFSISMMSLKSLLVKFKQWVQKMLNFVTVLVVSIFCLVTLILMMRALQKRAETQDKLIVSLVNRLMSPDVRTFNQMTEIENRQTTNHSTFSDLKSQNDESVAMRLARAQGLGQPVFDEETDMDELREMFSDLGVIADDGNESNRS